MQKEKLYFARKSKGYTQQDIAKILPTDLSNYSRKEGGEVKITIAEWEKIAAFLKLPLEDIFEENVSKAFVNVENSTLAENTCNYNSNNTNDKIIQNLHDYIELLKDENCALKEKLNSIGKY